MDHNCIKLWVPNLKGLVTLADIVSKSHQLLTPHEIRHPLPLPLQPIPYFTFGLWGGNSLIKHPPTSDLDTRTLATHEPHVEMEIQ